MNINDEPKIAKHRLMLRSAVKMPVPATNGMSHNHAVFIVIKESSFQNLSLSQQWLTNSDFAHAQFIEARVAIYHHSALWRGYSLLYRHGHSDPSIVS